MDTQIALRNHLGLNKESTNGYVVLEKPHKGDPTQQYVPLYHSLCRQTAQNWVDHAYADPDHFEILPVPLLLVTVENKDFYYGPVYVHGSTSSELMNEEDNKKGKDVA